MNASENLNAAGILVEKRPENGNVHASSIMQLCRSAMDASARTIWLLSDPDSEVRRDRCLSLLMEQLEQQRRFLKINDDNVNRGPSPPPGDCGRSSVQESCLTRGPLLRTRRASAATGSMCEVTGCATTPTGSNEPLYGRTDTNCPTVYSSMVGEAASSSGEAVRGHGVAHGRTDRGSARAPCCCDRAPGGAPGTATPAIRRSMRAQDGDQIRVLRAS